MVQVEQLPVDAAPVADFAFPALPLACPDPDAPTPAGIPPHMTKARAYFQLLKFRLSLTVAFSSAMGYLLGMRGELDWRRAGLVLLGGLLVTGSANIINQIYERELDKLMTRTAKRPLPTGVLSPAEAWVFCVLLGVRDAGASPGAHQRHCDH